MTWVVLVVLVTLHSPEGGRVDVNVDEIVALRSPQGSGLLDDKVNCVILTVDGKFISVVESCETARLAIESGTGRLR